MTAYDWADIEQEAKEAGVTAFVGNPLQQIERANRYSGKKVLLVEDNELNREIATALLEEIETSVDCVEDGTNE